jgi:hypothetical protein
MTETTEKAVDGWLAEDWRFDNATGERETWKPLLRT